MKDIMNSVNIHHDTSHFSICKTSEFRGRHISTVCLALAGFVPIIILNVLYGRLLLKYWKLKRKLSKRRLGNFNEVNVLPVKSKIKMRHRLHSDGRENIDRNVVKGRLDYPFCSPYKNTPNLLSVKTIDVAGGLVSSYELKIRPFQKGTIAKSEKSIAALRKANDFFARSRYVFTIMFVFTICWTPILIFTIWKMVFFLNKNVSQTVYGSCNPFRDNISSKMSYGYETNASNFYQLEVGLVACTHNFLINKNVTSCIIESSNVSTYNNYDVCKEILCNIETYRLRKRVLIPYLILSLAAIINPLICGMLSKDFQAQIAWLKRRFSNKFK